MIKLFGLAITLALLFSLPLSVTANPFLSGSGPDKEATRPNEQIAGPEQAPARSMGAAFGFSPYLARIIKLQAALNSRISGLISQVSSEKQTGALFLLLALAFAYGVLHAAGPGHGKAVAASFVLARGGGIGQGLFLGNLIAFFHALSGVLLVLLVRFVLDAGFSGSMEQATYWTQVISYSLITVLGAWLLLTGLFKKTNHPQATSAADSVFSKGHENKNIFTLALVTGMVPCPGVILVLLFCLAKGAVGLGLALTVCLAGGMALTISVVTLMTLGGKKVFFRFFQKKPDTALKAVNFIEVSGAFLIMILGLFFLLPFLFA
ncbi:nickel/cobalt transporter [Dethiosulfatarculus sandiegensis]|uniref:Nickel/cobalt efflux system n=1 Tax=Dethiosulfatarculus sandiegensis TaxID=1429043 RepID=A0A0D2HT46_9BACT|nr:hypothetical protein [Dethiosulfatarculus sandiegensis]KIX13718.1 nickel transporter [Dethiosulfatarculus sandiegensis]